MKNLLLLSWRSFTRSASFGKSLGTKIFLAFISIYFFATFLILGYHIGEIISEEFPNDDPFFILNGFLLAYLGLDLFLRQLLQELPTAQIKPLLILNIRKSKIISHLLRKSLLNFFNILPLFMLIPAAIMFVSPNIGVQKTWIWLICFLLLIINNHFISIWLKWKFNENGYGFYVFVGILAGLFALDYFAIIDIKAVFADLINNALLNPILLSLLLIPIGIFYFLNYKFLHSQFYLNILNPSKKDDKIRDYSWLNSLGENGKIISLDLRLIWRNKRPRSQVTMTFLFLLYGLMLYKPEAGKTSDLMFVIAGLIMMSMFSMVYGQFFPAWHSKYFSMLMAQNFRMKQFLQSFFILSVITGILFYILTLPYAFMHTKIIYTHLALLLYNIGVNTYIIFMFGLTSKRAIDMDGSAFFNYQGVGAAQWLFSFPLMLGPVLIFALVRYLTQSSIIGFATLAILGIIGIALQPVLINYFTNKYLAKKHQLIRNYKNS